MCNFRRKRTWPGTSLRLPGKFSLAFPGWRWDSGRDQSQDDTFFVQGTALYELYLSIQQRALRAFHDPGTWGGLGSGDVLSMLTMAGEHLQVPMKTSNCAYKVCHDPWGFLEQILLEVRYFPLGMYWLSEVRASTPGRGETLWTGQVWKTFWLIKKFKTYWLIKNLKLSGW